MAKPARPDIESLPLKDLEQRVARARKLIAEAKALLPGLVELTDEDRLTSTGKMRDGEPEILKKILDAVDRKPEPFASLADEDEGHDPNKLETQLLRERLVRRALLAGLATDLDGLSRTLGDTVLWLGERVRPVAHAAYRIGKTLSKTDATLRTAFAAAIDFFTRPANAAAATKAAKKKAKPAP